MGEHTYGTAIADRAWKDAEADVSIVGCPSCWSGTSDLSSNSVRYAPSVGRKIRWKFWTPDGERDAVTLDPAFDHTRAWFGGE